MSDARKLALTDDEQVQVQHWRVWSAQSFGGQLNNAKMAIDPLLAIIDRLLLSPSPQPSRQNCGADGVRALETIEARSNEAAFAFRVKVRNAKGPNQRQIAVAAEAFAEMVRDTARTALSPLTGQPVAADERAKPTFPELKAQYLDTLRAPNTALTPPDGAKGGA